MTTTKHNWLMAGLTLSAAALVAAGAAFYFLSPAQRIALELKDKVSQEDVSAVSVGGAAPVQSMAADCVTEALEALQALGYTPAEARNAVQSVRDQSDKTDELIKLALRSMAGM